MTAAGHGQGMDQHRKITGYRELGENDIDVINSIKNAEAALADLWKAVKQRPGTNPRWAAMAQTSMEQATMFLVRAVANPETPFATATPNG